MTEDAPVPDSLTAWIARYQRLMVAGVRSPAVATKIALHLGRFQAYFAATYGHDQLSAGVRRDVLGWQAQLRARPLAPVTVNNHLASLTAFTAWVTAQAPTLFAADNPGTPIGELGLGPLEPRALTACPLRKVRNFPLQFTIRPCRNLEGEHRDEHQKYHHSHFRSEYCWADPGVLAQALWVHPDRDRARATAARRRVPD